MEDNNERNNIVRTDILDTLINLLSSFVGSLTNPKKLADTFTSNGYQDVSINTINSYLNYLIEKVKRYDVKDNIIKWYTEEGILVIGILEFLLNKDSLDL